jgi:predicted nuclease of predicted toxin-antitoxin system
MKFLTDQDVFAGTVRFLGGLGHDVVTAAQLGMSQAVDADLLQAAQRQNRIFVTRDRDFGNLVFVQSMGAGVIYLRLSPSTMQSAHAELEHVLTQYTEAELTAAFVVVEPGRHRLRKLQQQGP